MKEHKDVLTALKQAQDAEHDQRENARDADLFCNKKDGQWEPKWWNINDGKPRYTFDLTTPIVDQIVGDIQEADFGVEVEPTGASASEDAAKLLNGIVRHIQNLSNADDIYTDAARGMVTSGIDGWRVVQKYHSDDSFDQDLIIEPIPSFIDRVWFGNFSERAAEDSEVCFVMQALDPADYKERWPDGSEQSVSIDTENNAYFQKRDLIIVGEVYYFKEVSREIALLSNGKVYEVNDDYTKLLDSLKAAGIEEVKRRKAPKKRVYTRLFDGNGWLEDEQETVFSSIIPVVPLFGNFKVSENKVTYRGVVEKLQDPQRVLNYSLSREIEEGALAPRAKYWMTETQAEGHEDTLETLNTNNDPVQFYNPDPQAPGAPQQSGGAQVNPGLRNISTAMQQTIGYVSNMFAANMGDNPGLQSGVAIKELRDTGSMGTRKYFAALERAITKTCRILVDSIPEVYGPGRQVRLVQEDGTNEIVTIGEEVQDPTTGQMVVMNEIVGGDYAVVCTSGPSYQNRQSETVSSMIEVAGVDPSIIQMGGDILLKNITAPGMGDMAERKRQQLFMQGMIPINQMTEEEKQAYVQMMQANAQSQGQDAATILAQAEMGKAQAQLMDSQTDQLNAQANFQKAQGDLQLKARGQELEEAKFAHTQNKDRVDQLMDVQRMQMEQVEGIMNEVKGQAETLKLIREAMGVDSVVTPGATQAYQKQANSLNNSIEDAVIELEFDPVSGQLMGPSRG